MEQGYCYHFITCKFACSAWSSRAYHCHAGPSVSAGSLTSVHNIYGSCERCSKLSFACIGAPDVCLAHMLFALVPGAAAGFHQGLLS